ncbi:unnamed protein product [Rotaria sp. Silwood1]|nr:unnamed protein product [Rotaria sp. Silwood1]CAF3375879.1 unnamed protein product [Rotaria sp. Silwood1]CAF4622443.1 unnamed protein product [Rotaria sp. Silwood1]CAF4671454.1 unnamed protein product [Rotaria sp. Silwood1]
MFLTKFLTQRSLTPSYILFNVSRALQHQTSTKKSTDTYPKQNRKPKFDAINFADSLKPYAEDLTLENQHEKLSNLILPLSNHSYDEQLKIKQDIIEQAFDQIGRAILWDKRVDSQVLKYVEFQEGNFCHVESIVPSPIIDHYRCKDDLSCGYGVDGEKTIGFYINPKNSKKFPNTLCIPPINLKSMKPKHVLVVKHFDQFLKQHPLSVCENTNILKKDQYWRSIALKSNEQDDLMMTVIVHPQSLSKNEINQMKKDLLNYFTDGSGRECEINSIYFQICAQNRCTSEENPFELIYGNEFIYEIYNEKKFRISPESLLPVNKKAAEIIYTSTLKHAQIDENTIVLDIGSGIGVHAILASFIAKKVYAIDPLTLCIENGKFNAKLNGCRDNIEWICGSAEINLHRILKKIGDLHGDHSCIVVIVNPSRYSLSNRTTTVLRSFPSIQRILYVSSKSDEQIMHNFYELAAGERSKLKQIGAPFIPTSIYPVDLFPHTTHAETIVNCVRV